MSKLAIVGLIAAQVVCALPAPAGPACEAGHDYRALDLSHPVDDGFLQNIKSIGISTIIRYYDWPQETLPGKTLTAGELASMKRNSLNVAVVFQHNNNRTTTFETVGRGTIDASRALDLANAYKQPPGSAIYFGVDGVDGKFQVGGTGGANDKFGINLIERYFGEIESEFASNRKNAGYAIGAYGSGLVCRTLLDERRAKYCWLANATSWPEYDVFERSGRWSLKQLLPSKRCFGEEVDLDIVNPNLQNFGQWMP
jgi:Domain of unknown function (DUF1906)